MKKYIYATNCVSVPKNRVDYLHMVIDLSDQITRKTFLSHVSRKEMETIELNLGYAHHNSRKNLTMAQDHHVRYFKSKVKGRTLYFFTWSGIEYIFTSDGTF